MAVFALFFNGCVGTTELNVEIRVKLTDPTVERIHMVTPVSIGSTRLYPFIRRKDSQFNYYQYQGLLQGTRQCFVLVDFSASSRTENNKKSEVYDLQRLGLSISEDWSHWLSPQSIGHQIGQWGGVDFQVMNNMEQASKNVDTVKKDSQLRYTLKKWEF